MVNGYNIYDVYYGWTVISNIFRHYAPLVLIEEENHINYQTHSDFGCDTLQR